MSIFTTMNNYGKMVKFSHTLFALPFAGLASIIAILQSNLSVNDFLSLYVCLQPEVLQWDSIVI